MSKLTLVVKITAKQGQIETALEELTKLVGLTRAEEGCLNYDLHVDNDNPALFVVHENWASHAHWEGHMDQQHLKDYLAIADEIVELAEVNMLTQIA